MTSAKLTKIITSPTSTPSSFDTPPSSQLKCQPQSSIPPPLLSTVTSPYIPNFPSSPTPTTHSSISAPPSTSRYHLEPHLLSKVLPETPGSSLYVAQYVTEEIQISPLVVPHVACGFIHLNLLARTTTKLFLVEILFLLFYKTLNMYLLFSHSYYTYVLDFY